MSIIIPNGHEPEPEVLDVNNTGSDHSDSEYSNDASDDSDSDDGLEIAKKLGDQLWAEINKAQADRAQGDASTSPRAHPFPLSNTGKEKALNTTRLILSCLERDPEANSIFSNTFLDGQSLSTVLTQAILSGVLTKSVAQRLHPVIKSLATSEALFSSKRKRNDEEDRTSKRSKSTNDFHNQIVTAVEAILSSLTASSLDPALVSSLQLPLHQIWLFSSTISSKSGPYAHLLQEISGLIQVIGVLSGVPIGNNTYPSSPFDIGAAVYPCLLSGCSKTFERLYHLRSHQRCHSDQRPHRCTVCPAAFARSHDLKRHTKLHDRKAWKCGNCLKMFSRRDAIKRHMNRSGVTCEGAEITEVDVEGAGEQTRDDRLTKIWSNGPPEAAQSELEQEEGELESESLLQLQNRVTSLHGLLKSLVGNTPGSAGDTSHSLDPAQGQAALANVIARAQLSATAATAAMSTVAQNQAITVPEPSPEGQLINPYGLSDEQAKILEQAIANAAAAAQAQAEAEAAMEEEEDSANEDEDEDS